MIGVDIKQLSEQLSGEFLDNQAAILKNSPEILNSNRLSSLSEFKKIGLPGEKDENYKYLHVSQSFAGKYKKYYEPQLLLPDIKELFTCDIPEFDTHYILVNGWFTNGRNLTELPGGIIAGSLRSAAQKFPGLVEKHFAKYISLYRDPLSMLSSAFAQDGLFVYLPAGSKPARPVQLINLVVADEELMISPHNLIVAEENSSADILICDHSINPQRFLMNGNTEVFAGKNSRLNIYRQQNAHNHSTQFTNTVIFQESHSSVNSVFITLHGGTVRNNLYVKLNGRSAFSGSYGLWLCDKTQQNDNNIFIHHAAPDCTSEQRYKGILDDSSLGIFSGRILVDKGAQKTSAYQINKNLLLTSDAKARSKPQLEIYADDVKCSHGSATGQLDEDAMFYMCSRGISRKEACQLLMQAFASEITDKINILPLRNEINDLVERRLKGELSRCNRCKVSCNL